MKTRAGGFSVNLEEVMGEAPNYYAQLVFTRAFRAVELVLNDLYGGQHQIAIGLQGGSIDPVTYRVVIRVEEEDDDE